MADLFWLSDEQWAVIEPFMPKDDLPSVSRFSRTLRGTIAVTGMARADSPGG